MFIYIFIILFMTKRSCMCFWFWCSEIFLLIKCVPRLQETLSYMLTIMWGCPVWLTPGVISNMLLLNSPIKIALRHSRQWYQPNHLLFQDAEYVLPSNENFHQINSNNYVDWQSHLSKNWPCRRKNLLIMSGSISS